MLPFSIHAVTYPIVVPSFLIEHVFGVLSAKVFIADKQKITDAIISLFIISFYLKVKIIESASFIPISTFLAAVSIIWVFSNRIRRTINIQKICFTIIRCFLCSNNGYT